jgi:hypothetical protein
LIHGGYILYACVQAAGTRTGFDAALAHAAPGAAAFRGLYDTAWDLFDPAILELAASISPELHAALEQALTSRGVAELNRAGLSGDSGV